MSWYLYFVLGFLVGTLAGLIVFKVCNPKEVGTFHITDIESDEPYKLELIMSPEEFKRYRVIGLKVDDESKKIHSL